MTNHERARKRTKEVELEIFRHHVDCIPLALMTSAWTEFALFFFKLWNPLGLQFSGRSVRH